MDHLVDHMGPKSNSPYMSQAEINRDMLSGFEKSGVTIEDILSDDPTAVKRHERWFGKQARLINRSSVPIKERIAGIKMQLRYKWDNIKESASLFVRERKAGFARRHVRASAWWNVFVVYPVAVQRHLLSRTGDDLPDGKQALRSMLQIAFAEEGYDPHGDFKCTPASYNEGRKKPAASEEKPGPWDRYFNGVIVK